MSKGGGGGKLLRLFPFPGTFPFPVTLPGGAEDKWLVLMGVSKLSEVSEEAGEVSLGRTVSCLTPLAVEVRGFVSGTPIEPGVAGLEVGILFGLLLLAGPPFPPLPAEFAAESFDCAAI